MEMRNFGVKQLGFRSNVDQSYSVLLGCVCILDGTKGHPDHTIYFSISAGFFFLLAANGRRGDYAPSCCSISIRNSREIITAKVCGGEIGNGYTQLFSELIMVAIINSAIG